MCLWFNRVLDRECERVGERGRESVCVGERERESERVRECERATTRKIPPLSKVLS